MVARYCPHCLRPYPPKLTVTGPIRRRLVDIVSNRADGITRAELISALYSDDPNGGPASDNIIAVMAYHANKQLRSQGYRINVAWRGRGARYHLTKLPTVNKKKKNRKKN